MIVSLSVIGVLFATDPLADDEARRIAGQRQPAFPGYRAEVQVCLAGVTRHGSVIVARDRTIHLEHLDEPAAQWAHAVLRPSSTESKGWNDRPLRDRAGPVHRVAGRLGPWEVPTEIRTQSASLEVSRHQLLSNR